MEFALVLCVLFFLLLFGAPIFLALGAAGLTGLFLERGSSAFMLASSSVFSQLHQFELVALPLFILMGFVLVETPIGRELFRAAEHWLGRLPGGLAISTVGTCTVFGAMSGVSIAGVASVGALAVPEMLNRGYSRSLAAGSVVTAGALAMLIPPSVPFIIYSAMTGVSISDLFTAGIVPGLTLALAFSLYIFVRAVLNPSHAPKPVQRYDLRSKLKSLSRIWHSLLLIGIVLGAIYGGVATPSEASALGAFGAFLIAGFIYRSLSLATIRRVFAMTVNVTAGVLLIMAAARIFGDYMNLARIPYTLSEAIVGMQISPLAVIFVIALFLIVLGMFVDASSIIVVTTPVLLPVVTALHYDPLWFGVILVLTLEIAVVTPPVGLNLYALRGTCPFLSLHEIILSAIPFVAIQFLVLALFIIIPELSLWLPSVVHN